MFIETISSTFVATFQILFIGWWGVFLVRKKIIDNHGLAQLSGLVINFLLPFFFFYQLTTHFSYKQYPFWWAFPLISFSLFLGAFLIGKLVIFDLPKGREKNEFLALMSFQNSGYLPLMIVTSIFSGALMHKLYIYIFLYIIGFNLLLWTIGVSLLRNDQEQKIETNALFHPPFVAIVLTLIFIFLGGVPYIPQGLVKPVKMLGDCALPLAIIIMGGNLASMDFVDINKKVLSIFVVTKMVLYPLLGLAIVLMFKIKGCMGFLIVLETAVPSAITLSVICRHYNIETRLISQGLFFSHIVSIFTVPLFLTLYMKFTPAF